MWAEHGCITAVDRQIFNMGVNMGDIWLYGTDYTHMGYTYPLPMLSGFIPSFVYVGLFVFPLGGGTLAFGYGRPTPATVGILEIGPRGARVPGTLPTKFGLPRPFRFPSRWRHGTDGQTDRQTDSIDT